MVPDRAIAKKLRQYDRYLYLSWNNRKQYFELWREMAHGHKLITPITLSIYEAGAPISYCPLDERLLWWVAAADSWKTSPKEHALASDQRWIDFIKKQDQARRATFYDYGKDLWSSANAFYTTKYSSKNTGPKFNHVPRSNWLKPDVQSKVLPRIWYRSNQNAKRLGFQR